MTFLVSPTSQCLSGCYCSWNLEPKPWLSHQHKSSHFTLLHVHFLVSLLLTALLCLVWQLSQISFPFIFPPLFVFPSVFSSHLLFEPQLQGSVFLPSICLVTCPQTNEPAAPRVPPVRLCQLNPHHREHWLGSGLHNAWPGKHKAHQH